jgi:hypothetical protein
VADVCPDVEAERDRVEVAIVLAERLPLPRDAGGHGGTGHVLHALHEEHEIVAIGDTTGGESDAAVAHHHGGDAVVARRRAERVPRDLRVEMSMDVDEAGRDELAARVDHLCCRTLVVASDADDAAIRHRDVGLEAGATAAVDDEAATDDQVGTHGPTL